MSRRGRKYPPAAHRFQVGWVESTEHSYNGEPCWEWQGNLKSDGYAQFRAGPNSRKTQVHRWSYEHHVAPIPEELVIDHLCRVPHCVNPAHLEPVTFTENIRRGRNAQREMTHCKRGHEFNEANTYKHKGKRRCKACVNQLRRDRREGERL